MSKDDPLDIAEAMMDDEGGNTSGRAVRAALWIALDIARTLRSIRWELDRIAERP